MLIAVPTPETASVPKFKLPGGARRLPERMGLMRWIWILLVFVVAMVAMAEEGAQLTGLNDISVTGLMDHSQMGTDCLSCHDDIIPSSNSHMISSNDDCQFCHNLALPSQTGSSSSGEVFGLMLTETDDYVCTACHVEQDVMEQEHNIHLDMGCTSCHDPHGSSYGKMWVESEADLCVGSCHGDWDIGITHPTGEDIRDPYADASMSCVSSCHSVHQPVNDSRMLQVSYTTLCNRCHPDKG